MIPGERREGPYFKRREGESMARLREFKGIEDADFFEAGPGNANATRRSARGRRSP